MGSVVTTTATVGVDVGMTTVVGVEVGSGVDSASSEEVTTVVDLGSTGTVGMAVGVGRGATVGGGVAAGVGLGPTGRVGTAVGLGVLATGRVATGAWRLSAAGVSSAAGLEASTPRKTNPTTPPTSSARAATDIALVASLRGFNSDLPIRQVFQKSTLY